MKSGFFRGVTGLALVAGAMLVSGGTARADIIYTYTGQSFNSFYGNSNGLTTTNSITGYIDVATELGDNFDSFNNSNSVPVLLSWSLSDGVNTLSSALGDITSGNVACTGCLNLETDASGDIISWDFYATNGSGLVMIASNTGEILNDGLGGSSPTNDVSSQISVGSAWVGGSETLASWSESATPEPSTLLLFAGGFGALAWRRKRA